MQQPLIAVTTSELEMDVLIPGISSDDNPKRIAVSVNYVNKLKDYKLTPLLLLNESKDLEEVLALFDGVLLTGGPDIDPRMYNEEPDENLMISPPEADSFEISVAKTCDKLDLPCLAICRGMQVLNVARGGNLYQDLQGEELLPSHQKDRINMRSHDRHPLLIEENSLLEKINTSPYPQVNSLHHQGVKNLGENLQVAAKAPDGIIEALEDSSRSFCLGIQWHAESLDGLSDNIFEEFSKHVYQRKLKEEAK